MENFPYSWFEKFYRLIYSIVFLFIAVGGFMIIRQFPRHLFSVLYIDRSGIHHLQ